jgi:hypothetical protein
LIFTLIFEGLARKMAPAALGIGIFFFKEFLAVILLLLCLKGDQNVEAMRLLGVMRLMFVLLLPCFIATMLDDPVLAVFGLKQYLLFPTVAVAMCAAYLPDNRQQLFSLFRMIALSLFVTTLVAVAQNRLPRDNWLNLSVGGDDLSAFSAGGYLRVSSTFAFVGQYCYYLNALCYFLPAFFYFKKAPRTWMAIVQAIFLLGLFVVGMFVTGSRLAVLGNLAVCCAGGLLLIVCGGGRALIKLTFPIVAGIVLLGVMQQQYPEFFAAYQARMGGATDTSHSIEVKERVEEGLLGWTSGLTEAPPSLFGYGLGVMSNGSEKLSAYAAHWRSGGFWTETDQATTLFEGGWYLVLIWYGFRFWVIMQSLIIVLRLSSLEYKLIACFAWGFILVVGLVGTLAIQPPLAIWWWLAVGLIRCLDRFDHESGIKINSSF